MAEITLANDLRIRVLGGIVAGIAPIFAAADENTEWMVSQSGGSFIEMPVFMTDGWVRALLDEGVDYGTAFEPERFPVQLRQYRTEATGRPFDYLQATLGSNADEVTYRYDQDRLGAISGYTNDRTEIFYGMCKNEQEIVCFDMHWPKEMQGMFGPIVERIARSFREGL